MLDPEPPTEPDWVSAKMSRLEQELRDNGLEEWEVERALLSREAELMEAQFAEDR